MGPKESQFSDNSTVRFKFRYTFREGNPPVTGGISSQMVSKVENVSISWCNHVSILYPLRQKTTIHHHNWCFTLKLWCIVFKIYRGYTYIYECSFRVLHARWRTNTTLVWVIIGSDKSLSHVKYHSNNSWLWILPLKCTLFLLTKRIWSYRLQNGNHLIRDQYGLTVTEEICSTRGQILVHYIHFLHNW